MLDQLEGRLNPFESKALDTKKTFVMKYLLKLSQSIFENGITY